MLDELLLDKLKRRAADPARRTDAPPSTRGRMVSLGPLSLAPASLRGALAGKLETVEEKPEPVAAPTTDAALDAAEGGLGFALPQSLLQVLRLIGDGGYGPGAGLMPLALMVSRYREFTLAPSDSRKPVWPQLMLPISWTDPGCVCLDCETGKVMFWGEEGLARSESGQNGKHSFTEVAPTFSAWFAAWVDTLSPEQRAYRMMQDAMINGLRTTIAHWRNKTPDERRAFGLPEYGWEEKLFGHTGIDLRRA